MPYRFAVDAKDVVIAIAVGDGPGRPSDDAFSLPYQDGGWLNLALNAIPAVNADTQAAIFARGTPFKMGLKFAGNNIVSRLVGEI